MGRISASMLIKLKSFWKVYVTTDEITDIVNDLNEHQYSRLLSVHDARIISNYRNSYYINERKSCYDPIQVYCYTEEHGFTCYETTNDTNKDNRRKNGELTGSDAYKALQEKFKENNNVTYCKAFGTTSSNEFNHMRYKKPVNDYIACVPKQFYYLSDNLKAQRISTTFGCSMVDFSSHYPASLSEELPTAKGSKRLKGRIKPNKDYPFAFYLNTGTVSFYYNDELVDTHDWINSEYGYCVLDSETIERIKNVKDEDEVTVLMKKSNYSFKEEIEYFYARRKVDPIAKLVMNAAIGSFHLRNYDNMNSKHYAHLAAITIARCNHKMLKLAEQVKNDNHEILQIVVDSLLYKGEMEYGTSDKVLGQPHQEFTDAIIAIRRINQYIVEKDGVIIKACHSAYDATDDGSDIDNPTSLDAIEHWAVSEKRKEINRKFHIEY